MEILILYMENINIVIYFSYLGYDIIDYIDKLFLIMFKFCFIFYNFVEGVIKKIVYEELICL